MSDTIPHTNMPPKMARRLLRWRLSAGDMELVDSLDEVFAWRTEQFGESRARRLYWKDVLDLCVFGTGRTYDYANQTGHLLMYSHYFKIAWRALRKQKAYALINTAGLALGLAICLLVFLFVRDELSYDRFHADADRIYRVNQINYSPDGSIRDQHAYSPILLGPTLETDLPEVDAYVHFLQHQDYYVRHGDTIVEEAFLFASDGLFEVFSFPLIAGDPGSALQAPDGVVLTQSMAHKYFGETNPIGQTLSIRFDEAYEAVTVTGVTEDPPVNASIRFDFVLPIERLFAISPFINRYRERWDGYFTVTYVRFAENTAVETAEAKLADFRLRYHGDEAANLRDSAQWTSDGAPAAYTFHALTDTHLDPSIDGGLSPTSNPRYSYILSGIALVILLIACINFMTLAIGRSSKRAREIGMRKVIGARRSQLIEQFLGEALVLSAAGGLGAVALTYTLLPVFNTLADKAITFTLDPLLMGVLIALLFLTGLVAGSYPALVLSALKPIAILKNKLRLSGANGFTKSLVVVQFGISVFLIATTLLMLRQMDYIRSANVGFHKEHVVSMPIDGLDGDDGIRRFRDALLQHTDIASVTKLDNSFAAGGGFQYVLDFRGTNRTTYTYRVDPSFLDVLDLTLVAGRNFDEARETDIENAVLVNETLVREFELENPIGERLTDFTDSPETDPIIIGVFKDYNFRSLYEDVQPLTLTQRAFNGYNYAYIRIQPSNIPETLALIEATWNEHAPDVPFTYTFLDDTMQEAYAADERWSTIVQYAAFLAIFIACLGLFGLTAYTTAQRTKEIGVRKVMGASVFQVLTLLSRDFVVLVFGAFLLATPLAYIAIQRWLDTFAFRIDIGVGVFLASGLLTFALAMLTVAYQALRAARVNPIDSLRTE